MVLKTSASPFILLNTFTGLYAPGASPRLTGLGPKKKQEAGLISILVYEHSGSIDALGAKGDFFLD